MNKPTELENRMRNPFTRDETEQRQRDKLRQKAKEVRAAHERKKSRASVELDRRKQQLGTAARTGRLAVRPRLAYGVDSPHSYFRDMATVQLSNQMNWDAQAAGLTRNPLPFSPLGDVVEARQRLATIESRDVTAAGGAAGFATTGLPAWLTTHFTEAARAEAVIASALPSFPLPDSGMTVGVPRFSTGTSVGVQATEAATNTESDPAFTTQAANVAYIVGQVDASQQAWDRVGAPGYDAMLARDLGAAIATKVDQQIMVGANGSGETLGFLNTTSALSVTYTDASPTAQETLAAIWKAYAAVADGSSGQGVSDTNRFAVILHPRRYAYLFGNAQSSQSLRPVLPGKPIISSAVRTTLGNPTNSDQDEAWVIVPDLLELYQGPVRFLASEQLSGTLQVRFVAYQAIATGFGRAPLAICRIAGTDHTATL